MLPLRVLLVEDSPGDAALVLRELRRGSREVVAERVEEEAAMRAALGRGGWDAIISDWAMPRFSGLEALAVVRSLDLDIPIIIVSGTIGEDTAVEAMRAGAHDFVLKDRTARLRPALDRELREHAARRAHRHAEAALLESRAQFARLAESGIVGLAAAELAGTVHEANDAYLQMIGYSRQDLLEHRIQWPALTAPEHRHLDEIAMRRAQASRATPPWDAELVRKDGTRVSVLIGIAPVNGGRCVLFMADLTPTRRAEEALRRTEEQLRQSQKMDAIGQLAGGIAHDFNNILTVIIGCSSMLAADLSPTDPMREDLEEIENAGARAAELTRQLLAFGRKQILAPRVARLDEIVRTVEKMLRRTLPEHVELTILTEADLGNVKVDTGQIEQVVLNLVVNARDAMPTGGKLTIETSNVVLDEDYAERHIEALPGRYVMLAISDTGLGMDRATQARVFEPFFTTKGPGKGTGLGLATVFGIIKQSNGSIWLYSEPGAGTTFKIYLPRTDEGASSTPMAPTTSSAPRGSETILVVEDEEGVRRLVRAVLQRQGYHVLDANGPGDALVICEQHTATIHLMVTDVIMPRMTGRQLADRVVAMRPSLKVLYMSGYTDNSIVHHGVLDSNVAFLAKPITPDTLARKVREVLDT